MAEGRPKENSLNSHMSNINTELANVELSVAFGETSNTNAERILEHSSQGSDDQTNMDEDFRKDIRLASSDDFGGSKRSVSACF